MDLLYCCCGFGINLSGISGAGADSSFNFNIADGCYDDCRICIKYYAAGI